LSGRAHIPPRCERGRRPRPTGRRFLDDWRADPRQRREQPGQRAVRSVRA